MKQFISSILVLGSLAASAGVAAAPTACREIHWREGTVVTISSAVSLGTRVQFPVDLVTKPVPSNKVLWDVDGAATVMLVKPNSVNEPEGVETMVRAFTTDGNAYDFMFRRVAAAQNEPCVIVKTDGQFFNDSARAGLQNLSSAQMRQGAAFAQQNAALTQQMAEERRAAADNSRKAVMEALRRYRYHIYTRYSWDQGKGFAAQNLISDVYDDGRFTYIRLNTPNRGLLSVESVIGEKNAIVPVRYDDAYGMYTINGIYPSFTLRVDDARISVSRADAKTFGE
ncbi:TPA: TrbG/VirB9 family P-type conjugative transfer protein [Pseudomonas aeruginosa]|uniref:TrbG/VirB9 family P-type conjugative transfer protein n=1 Tax=Pseudomonas aeruginosa TaxID=287 RepID=UPI00053D84ED|nr:TrbG/VirB9 family P-type conjugative transfer protein [Pseudomonas aeruginosa]NTT94293.1 TrbG/VirB9 family P-type conjugative transfer protein [Pseudomonas aeruginosa]HBO0862500.1 TrbG/VirB9 family P-type conjugative transfer protein [Pseudomonas aeruginosa]HBO1224099.1 TrbG/VirB9 family P-type conjugative transfer protein [Pseudomonas aeruginosa]HBO1396337.1 TrbG/VirB9 family P-type conjugative transfer protein [Pseudomonas aeruginosa]HBO1551467.1 TrbG/VirB9 family P-type conjugative trans